MSEKTKIQWCDSTVNPTMGCDGCELWKRGSIEVCYAGKLHDRRKGHKGFAPKFEQVTAFPGRIEMASSYDDLTRTPRFNKPWLHDLPRLIFVSDMSDCLSDGVSFAYLNDEIIAPVTTELGQRHHWLWLTKRPGRMAQFSEWLARQNTAWPENLWAGTSVTTQAAVSRVDQLLNVGNEKTLRFVSVEPQWEPIDLDNRLAQLDWVIHGGESGTIDHPFNLAWVNLLRDACRAASVPYFLKQLGAHIVVDRQRVKLKDKTGGNWCEWPKSLRQRQMPIYVGLNPRDVKRRDGDMVPVRWTGASGKAAVDCY